MISLNAGFVPKGRAIWVSGDISQLKIIENALKHEENKSRIRKKGRLLVL